MKIPLQEKIAELERRIENLEKAAKHSAQLNSAYVEQTQSGLFGAHWKRMWTEFDLAMKEAFGGRA